MVLAIDHSARDTYAMLAARGVPMVQKAFQFGGQLGAIERLAQEPITDLAGASFFFAEGGCCHRNDR